MKIINKTTRRATSFFA